MKKPGAVNPRLGYALAVVNMLTSGVAIYVNSIGVKSFGDSTLYTALKNALVGLVILLPLAFSKHSRAEIRHLTFGSWALLIVVSLIGGSFSYALYFRGLQLSTPVTASLVDHTQFLFVAALAALFLGERFGPAVWAALVVLLIGLSLGIAASAVRLDVGVAFLAGATLLFAADFTLMKYLLRSVSAYMVMLFKMSLGSLLLLLYSGLTGHVGAILRLTPRQWELVVVTGLILLAFTVTSILGLRHASAMAVTAIPAGSPIVTTGIVLLSQHVSIPVSRWIGLSLMLVAVLVVFMLGSRREMRDSPGDIP